MKDIHKYTVVLQNFTGSSPIKKYAEPYQKYIALKNRIDYYRSSVNDIQYTINYDIIIGISDYCIFNQTFFLDDIHNKIQNYYLVLPQNISMPLEITPFIAKNSLWFKDFLFKYQKSQLYNLEEFLVKADLLRSNLILFSDHVLGKSGTFIENLINMDIDSIKYYFKHNNKELGFL